MELDLQGQTQGVPYTTVTTTTPPSDRVAAPSPMASKSRLSNTYQSVAYHVGATPLATQKMPGFSYCPDVSIRLQDQKRGLSLTAFAAAWKFIRGVAGAVARGRLVKKA